MTSLTTLTEKSAIQLAWEGLLSGQAISVANVRIEGGKQTLRMTLHYCTLGFDDRTF